MPSFKNVNNINADLLVKPPIPVKVESREQEYKHSIVKQQDTPLSSLIAHVEGSSWTVDYYSQVKAVNEEATPYDDKQSPLNQQYHLIQSLELKLQDSSNSTDEKTQRIITEGSAVIYAGVIPNVGDVIISDVGGIAARLNVSRIEKKVYFQTTVYEIDFNLVSYITTKPEVDKINSYVVKRSVFNRDLLTYGSNPVILEENYNDYTIASDVRQELIDDFLKEFFSNELSTFLVPGYGRLNATYDPYVVEVFKAVVDINDHPLMRRLLTLNVNEIKDAYASSIWPVLLDPSVNRIRNVWRRAGPVSFLKFNINPSMHSFRYSGFKQCISPVEDLQNVDYYQGWAQLPKQGALLAMWRLTSVMTGEYGTAIGRQLEDAIKNQNKVCCHHVIYYHAANPALAPLDSKSYLDTVNLWLRATGHWQSCAVCGGCNTCCSCNGVCDELDDELSYALPASFWQNNVIHDEFNALVHSYLKGDRMNLSNIYKLINSRQTLQPKQRFYRMMILLIILTSALRSN